MYDTAGISPTPGGTCRAGKLCGEELGHSIHLYFGYDIGPNNPYGELASTTAVAVDGQTEARLSTAYRLDGRVAGTTARFADGTVRHTTDRYDALGRLIEHHVTGSDHAIDEMFSYDANGNMTRNRRALPTDGDIAGYGYTGLDEQSKVDNRSLPHRYDARGSRRYDGDGQRYRYDDETHLIGTENARREAWLHQYYPDGLRADTIRADDGKTRHYFYEDGQMADAENVWSGAMSHYLLVMDRAARWVGDGHGHIKYKRYLLADYIGSVVGEQNVSGKLESTSEYSAYGRRLADETACDDFTSLKCNPFGFDGEQQDSDTGDTYLRARYSDGYGRFITQDAVETMNRYVAFADDPPNLVDPDGHLAGPFDRALRWHASEWLKYTLLPAWGFKTTVLSSISSLLWSGGMLSSDALLVSAVSNGILNAIPVPGFGAAVSNVITQIYSQEAWSWEQFCGATGSALLIDIFSYVSWWRHMNNLSLDDANITAAAIRWHFTEIGGGVEGTVFKNKAGTHVYKIADGSFSKDMREQLASNPSWQKTLAQRHAEVLNQANAELGYQNYGASAVGPYNKILKQAFIKRGEKDTNAVLLQVFKHLKNAGWLLLDFNDNNIINGRIIDVGQTMQLPSGGASVTAPYSEAALQYFYSSILSWPENLKMTTSLKRVRSHYKYNPHTKSITARKPR